MMSDMGADIVPLIQSISPPYLTSCYVIVVFTKKRPGRVSNGPENGIQILQRVWSMELRYELGHGSLDTPCGQDLNLFSLLL